MDSQQPKNYSETLEQAAERIYHQWDAALANDDIDALMALYTTDAIIESPLIPYLLKVNQGICRGTKELRHFLEEVILKRNPEKRKYYRVKYLTDGKTLMWEYPRVSPTGDQMDFAEVMELENGLIKYHRVYWGWYGLNVINSKQYFKTTEV